MTEEYLRLLLRFARFGVLHREEVKNNLSVVKQLVRAGVAQKVFRRGKVFYELTPKALPLLELQRRLLLDQAAALEHLPRRSSVSAALLHDVRFLDERHPDARHFLFLGDWQLTRPVVPPQLDLAKYRYYKARGLH